MNTIDVQASKFCNGDDTADNDLRGSASSADSTFYFSFSRTANKTSMNPQISQMNADFSKRDEQSYAVFGTAIAMRSELEHELNEWQYPQVQVSNDSS